VEESPVKAIKTVLEDRPDQRILNTLPGGFSPVAEFRGAAISGQRRIRPNCSAIRDEKGSPERIIVGLLPSASPHASKPSAVSRAMLPPSVRSWGTRRRLAICQSRYDEDRIEYVLDSELSPTTL